MHFKLVAAGMFEDEGWYDEAAGEMPRTPVALAEDGWRDIEECSMTSSLADTCEASMYPGDFVLYRYNGDLVPAALIAPAQDGQWLARDSRHGCNLFHLASENIATRLPRPESL